MLLSDQPLILISRLLLTMASTTAASAIEGSAASTLLRAERVNLVMTTRDIDGRLMTSDSFQPGIDNSCRIEVIVDDTSNCLCAVIQ